MKQVTRWEPDTCGCVIDYDWEDSEPEATRTHAVRKIVGACPAHAGLSEIPAFDTVLDENRRKSRAFGIAQELIPLAPPLSLDDYRWSFDDNRVLKVSMARLSTAQRAILQARFNSEFGPGKAEIQG